MHGTCDQNAIRCLVHEFFALVTVAPTSGVSSHQITQSGHVETEPSHTKHYWYIQYRHHGYPT